MEIFLLALYPERAGIAFHQSGQNAHYSFGQGWFVAQVGKFLGELEPFIAIIVLVVKEVLADEDHQAAANTPRQQKCYQKCQGNGDEQNLKGFAPLTAQGAHVVTADGQQ